MLITSTFRIIVIGRSKILAHFTRLNVVPFTGPNTLKLSGHNNLAQILRFYESLVILNVAMCGKFLEILRGLLTRHIKPR